MMSLKRNEPLVFEFEITSGDFAGGGKAASEVKEA